jgi:hypothetical protein
VSIHHSNKNFLRFFYRFKPLRFLIIFVVILFLLYMALAYIFVPFLLTKVVQDHYHQATGHRLKSDDIVFNPFRFTLKVDHLKDSENLWQAERVLVDVALLESIRQHLVVINNIEINKFIANPHQSENGLWNFDDVVKRLDASNKKIKVPKTPAEPAPVFIKELVFAQATINTNVLALNNLALTISPLNLSLQSVDLRGNSSAALNLAASINQLTPLSLKGKVNLDKLQAELDVDINSIPFVWFNSTIAPYLALDILEGKLETQAHISIAAGALQTLRTRGKITQVKLRPAKIEQDILKWKAFAWENAQINFVKKEVAIPLISLDEFDGQFIIHKDRTNSLQAILINTPAPVANAAPAVTPQQDSWRFGVDRIAINNAAVGFFDQSLTPSFMVIVQHFSGDITHISQDAETSAKINLLGDVDGTAPVHLRGEVKPFLPFPQADVLFSFQKMDMGALSPYSAEYAGWRIKKGLLSVDLHYRYEKGLIVGKNHVVIDHLEFGEKVRSPHAIDLPLRFGLALLTDENGIAVLDAEISGDPQSPTFNVGAVFMRVLRNTFKKIMSAPFRFLSGLIHSNEDLSGVTFASGESQLNEVAIAKLKFLQAALAKRPAMRIGIQGGYDAHTDVEALKEEQVKSALQKLGLPREAMAAHNIEWEQAVTALYKIQGLTNVLATAAEKYPELIAQEIVTEERLNNLAHERALAVKQYFVLGLGVASDRLLLSANAECSAIKKCARSEVTFAMEQ